MDGGDGESAGAFASVHWTAPEVLEDPEAFSKASDIYSFGIILWELITRNSPYEGMSPTGNAFRMDFFVFKVAHPYNFLLSYHD